MKSLVFLIMMMWLLPVVASAQLHEPEKDPLIWLRAGNPGDTAGVWQDISGNGYHGVFQQNILPDTVLFNYNRAFLLDINSPGFFIDYRPENVAAITVFAIYKPVDTSAEQSVWQLKIDSLASAGLTTHRMITAGKSITYATTTTDLPVINTMLQNWHVRTTDTMNRSLTLAGSDSLGFEGKLAEFILFDGVLPAGQFRKFHTYLAVKYGITLKQMHYVNGNNDIVWDYKQNSDWHNNVAGIAADTLLGLMQPQGSGMGGTAPLIIAAGTLTHEVNSSNNLLQQGDFLIWGDNNKPLVAPKPDSTQCQHHKVPNLLTRQWMMQCSGSNAHLIPTQVVFPGTLADSSIVIALVKDHTGTGLFHPDSVTMHTPDSMDAEGRVYFNNILWTHDTNGIVFFTFQVLHPSSVFRSTQQHFVSGEKKSNEELELYLEENSGMRCKLFPNPTSGHYSLIVTLPKEESITVKIYDQAGRVADKQQLPQAKLHHLEGTLKQRGIYLISVTSSAEQSTFKLIVK